jgi:ATP-dependent protease ClpP protease subunit
MRPQCRSDGMTIPIIGPISTAFAAERAAEIRAAVPYYGYDWIDLVLCSPGGEASALELLLDELEELRITRGVRVRTRAQGDVASAAALLLAFGDIGSRGAAPGSRILVHEPRAPFGGQVTYWTRADLVRAGAALDAVHDRLLDRLTQHIWAAAETTGPFLVRLPDTAHASRVDSAAALRDLYADLLREERWLTPAEAVGLGLVDRVEHPTPRAASANLRPSGPGRTP